jgi:hypothetical protein
MAKAVNTLLECRQNHSAITRVISHFLNSMFFVFQNRSGLKIIFITTSVIHA